MLFISYTLANVEGVHAPPPEIFKDWGTRGYLYNVNISRSVLMSQSFTCLSLEILFLTDSALYLRFLEVINPQI